jgi:glycine/D-amino acid oxidase-like deaminating enzyme
MYPGQNLAVRLLRFLRFGLRQLFVDIPNTLQYAGLQSPLSRTPFWLTIPNPLAEYPWKSNLRATLPVEVDTVVIGAGFTGSALAYHWSKHAPTHRVMAILEMDDPASGASGRNEGAVVMGRYFAMVRNTVKKHLPRVRHDLSSDQQEQMALQFAAAYATAAYRNGDLIEQTIHQEQFNCDYHREGWVQAKDLEQQTMLDETVLLAEQSGFTDWTKLTPAQVLERTGMKVNCNAGFSRKCASWHPAKWVWCLMKCAMNQPTVQLFTRTKVTRVEDAGELYIVHTSRGPIRARHVVNATESYTPLLHRQFQSHLRPLQTQMASGDGGPSGMKPNVVISGTRAFWGRHGNKTLFGSDATAVPFRCAGQNKPSRFITTFILGELKRYYGSYCMQVTNEWSGTVGETADEFPIVGVFDGKRQHIIAGMVGSGSGVSFNAARCTVNRILGRTDEPDDYPAEYFSPVRILNPIDHQWPSIRS